MTGGGGAYGNLILGTVSLAWSDRDCAAAGPVSGRLTGKRRMTARDPGARKEQSHGQRCLTPWNGSGDLVVLF